MHIGTDIIVKIVSVQGRKVTLGIAKPEECQSRSSDFGQWNPALQTNSSVNPTLDSRCNS